ncbi:MAG TPA: hypothetical protein VK196_00230 [Magnetospirillum sp.]|nr:hypothetical protein [Magnetospirillum sp.]
MERLAATKDVVDELQRLHRELHFAMTHLLHEERQDLAENRLHNLDVWLSNLINRTQVVR